MVCSSIRKVAVIYMYSNYLKRAIDILLSGAALLVLWPVLLIICVCIKLATAEHHLK